MNLTAMFRAMAYAAGAASPVGCGMPPEYGIAFKNDTPAYIKNARVDWQEKPWIWHETAGVLRPNADKGMGQEPRPIPRKATVTWTDADGKPHAQDVEVAKLVTDPPRFSGTIYFRINPDATVTVVPLTYDQIDELAAEHKKYP